MPEIRVRARSISRAVRDTLPRGLLTGEVMAVFRRACVVRTGAQSLFALVTPELEDGPLNIVLERAPEERWGVRAGMPVKFQGSRWQMGDWLVSVEDVPLWEPCPDWGHLRADAGKFPGRLRQLRDWLADRVPGDSMFAFLPHRLPAQPSMRERAGICVQGARVRDAVDDLWAGWQGDEARLSQGASRLAGLGVGLTPSGDDLLAGAMLYAWVAHPSPAWFCRVMVGACAPKTTLLSAALLRCAAAGECSAPWHRLLESLRSDSDQQLPAAAGSVLSHGHTSGADSLAGFLWMGLRAVDG